MEDPLLIGFYLLMVVFLVLLNGFFVASEFAIVKVRSTRIAELERQGNKRAKVAGKIVKQLDAYLSANQLGITLASLGLGRWRTCCRKADPTGVRTVPSCNSRSFHRFCDRVLDYHLFAHRARRTGPKIVGHPQS